MQAADAVLFSQRLRWTRESFEELLGLDAFQDRKLELVRGEVVVKELQKPPHANLIEELTERLTPALVGNARVRIRLPLVVDDETQLMPDVAVVDRRTSKRDHPFSALLVIEVSDTTARYDRLVKAPLYAQARVREYWRIDLGKRVVEVFNGRRATHSKGTLAVPGFPAMTIQIEELFDS